jgi:hypothetical protein
MRSARLIGKSRLGKPVRVRVRVDGEYVINRGEHTNVDFLGPAHAFGPDGLRLRTQAEMATN